MKIGRVVEIKVSFGHHSFVSSSCLHSTAEDIEQGESPIESSFDENESKEKKHYSDRDAQGV